MWFRTHGASGLAIRVLGPGESFSAKRREHKSNLQDRCKSGSLEDMKSMMKGKLGRS